MGRIGTALVVIGFVVLLPVLLPVALVGHGLYRRRLRASAKSFRCTACGMTLGTESLRLADEVCDRWMAEWFRQHPGVKARIVRTLHAICLNCGQQYRFAEKDRTFVPETAEPPLHPTGPAGKLSDR